MWSSGVWMSVTDRKVLGPRGWVTLAAFMMENFTSAEVSASPSWNITPWRSLKVMDLPSGETSQDSARLGCGCSSVSYSSSPS